MVGIVLGSATSSQSLASVQIGTSMGTSPCHGFGMFPAPQAFDAASPPATDDPDWVSLKAVTNSSDGTTRNFGVAIRNPDDSPRRVWVTIKFPNLPIPVSPTT